MYTTIVHWYPVPAKHEEAVAALTELAAQVQAGEPDTWMYLVHATATNGFPPEPPGTIVFIEGYKDKQAFLAHVKGPIFQGFVKQHGSLFVTIPGDGIFFLADPVEQFAGFLRPQAYAH